MTKSTKRKFKTVQDYLSSLRKDQIAMINELREAIQQAAPKAKEVISYNAPAYELDGILVWYSANVRYIGFYPLASAIEQFKSELTEYKDAKGSIKFSLEKPLPVALIKKIVKFRVKENLEKAENQPDILQGKKSKKNK